MKDTPWDHGLRIAAEADGLVGHAGAVLLRKLAGQVGLTAALGSALARAGKFPLVDRGVALVSMAVAIALGATSMNDITLLAHHAPVLGAEPSDTTVRRTLEQADPATLDKIARVRARVRAHVWKLICATPAGFPWLQIAGKLMASWLVIDMDATLITARSDKEGAAPTFKKGYGLPLGAWLANTTESLAMLQRQGNAGSNTFAGQSAGSDAAGEAAGEEDCAEAAEPAPADAADRDTEVHVRLLIGVLAPGVPGEAVNVPARPSAVTGIPATSRPAAAAPATMTTRLRARRPVDAAPAGPLSVLMSGTPLLLLGRFMPRSRADGDAGRSAGRAASGRSRGTAEPGGW
jgi:hypothetical protein